jgi:hypothetical protein
LAYVPAFIRRVGTLGYYYFSKGIKPNNITIITFNQDLQIEKILNKFGGSGRWATLGQIFSFPFCYRLDISNNDITAPSQHNGEELFNINDSGSDGVEILKLHGSLNWYSSHNSPNVSTSAMFRPNRKIRITRRQTIVPDMRLSGHRTQYTLPVIVPPVTHKSGILHNKVKKLWGLAETALKKADDITIFGYSCPIMDFESINLIQRAVNYKKNRKRISIIDPNSDVLKRYADLISPERLYYYPLPKYFLQDN